jgi:hypothetical protein
VVKKFPSVWRGIFLAFYSGVLFILKRNLRTGATTFGALTTNIFIEILLHCSLAINIFKNEKKV